MTAAVPLTPESVGALTETVRFARRTSREARNSTPTSAVRFVGSQVALWPVRVTGEPIKVDPDSGEVSDSGEAVKLYPAVWLQVNEVATGFDDREAVWLLPLPGAQFSVGDVALARLGGRRLQDGLVVYVAGGVAGPVDNCTGADWLAALRAGDCLRVTIEGDGAQSLSITSTDGATWNTESGALTICGNEYTASFARGGCDARPCLTLTRGPGISGGGGSGEATSYSAPLSCGGCNYAVFGFSRYELCPCRAPLDGGACANVVRVRVEWVKCATATAVCDGVAHTLPPTIVVTFGGYLATLPPIPMSLTTVEGGIVAYEWLGRLEFPGCPGAATITRFTVTGNAIGTSWCVPELKMFYTTSDDVDRAVDGFFTTPWSPHTSDVYEGDTGPMPGFVGPLPGYLCNPGGDATAHFVAGGAAPPGYDGAGWYLVTGTDAPAYLTDDTACGYTIRCGPFASEADATAAVGSEECGSTSPPSPPPSPPPPPPPSPPPPPPPPPGTVDISFYCPDLPPATNGLGSGFAGTGGCAGVLLPSGGGSVPMAPITDHSLQSTSGLAPGYAFVLDVTPPATVTFITPTGSYSSVASFMGCDTFGGTWSATFDVTDPCVGSLTISLSAGNFPTGGEG